MPTPTRGGANAILAALPAQERLLLAQHLVPVEFTVRQVLQDHNRPLTHLWFPASGVCSMISHMVDGASVEVATIGREGFIGLPLVLESGQSAQEIFVQIAGRAERLDASVFAELRPRLPKFERMLLRYAMTLVTQIAQGSACNRLHPIDARCARWLMQTLDRVDSTSFTLTHDFLALMLGVTRPSVTVAVGMLQKAGLIRYTRGRVEVLDPAALEAASCECYHIIKAEFSRLVGTQQ